MKEYFVQCREALAARLLQKVASHSFSLSPCNHHIWHVPLPQLDHCPHFKDTAELFSLRDLEEAHGGRLLPQLQEIHRLYANHIKHECLVRYGMVEFTAWQMSCT